jgi:hypothetical protein
MASLRGRPSNGRRLINPLTKTVKNPAVEANQKQGKRKTQRLQPLPASAVQKNNLKVADPEQQAAFEDRNTKEYHEMELVGSKGERYTVVVPSSYVNGVPKVWKWTGERYRVAELIAQGVPFAQIPDDPQVVINNRMTIYCWMEHPEFRNHVDGLIMETGWSSRRERLNNLKRMNDVLLQKVLREVDGMKLDSKNVGSLLTAIQAGAKLIAQEKGEFIEESKVSTDMTVEGKMVNIEAKMDDFVQSKTADEQAQLAKEFDAMGDDIIRALTGSKES